MRRVSGWTCWLTLHTAMIHDCWLDRQRANQGRSCMASDSVEGRGNEPVEPWYIDCALVLTRARPGSWKGGRAREGGCQSACLSAYEYVGSQCRSACCRAPRSSGIQLRWGLQIPDLQPSPAAPRRTASHRFACCAARRWPLDAQPPISIEWRLEANGPDRQMQAANGSCGRIGREEPGTAGREGE